jgi:RNA polymerase sigma factor (sigma-70 family)
MVNDRSDAAVIRDSLESPSEFAAIFERHFDEIYRYLARRLGAEAARDVAAEVFCTAFERRAAFDFTYSHALPWLFGIAANELRRHRRIERKRLRLLAAPDRPGDEGDGVAERADAFRLRRPMATALLTLPARDRETLLLYAWADLSYSEIAAALQIPIGTVRSRLNRARRTLRRQIDIPNNVTLIQEKGSSA